MNVRNLLTVNAIYVGLLALTGMLAPKFLLEIIGITAVDDTMALQRIIGAAVVGYMVVSWLMRSEHPSTARQAFLIGAGAAYLVTAVVFAINALSGVGNVMAWVFIATFLLLGIPFLNYGFRQPTASPKTTPVA